jgi:hypothetical protein
MDVSLLPIANVLTHNAGLRSNRHPADRKFLYAFYDITFGLLTREAFDMRHSCERHFAGTVHTNPYRLLERWLAFVDLVEVRF